MLIDDIRDAVLDLQSEIDSDNAVTTKHLIQLCEILNETLQAMKNFQDNGGNFG